MRTPLPANVVGILYILMAVFAGLFTSAIIKHYAPLATVSVLLTLRFLFSMPPLLAVAWKTRGWQAYQINRRGRLLARVLVGQCGILFWFLSIQHLPLGQATALFQSSAIFVTLLSPLILKEKVGMFRWSAVIVGLGGVVLITDPFSGGLQFGIFFGLASALSGAALAILLRLLGKTEQPISVALWHNTTGAVIYPLLMIFFMDDTGLLAMVLAVPVDWLAFIIVGIGAAMMQIGFTTAYRYGEAAVMVSIRYLSVPLAGLIGWLIWQEIPSSSEVAGMVVVVLSCLFISLREYRLARKANRAAASD